MEANIFTIMYYGTEYTFRIIPFLKSDKIWTFQVEDLPPASRFSIEQNENKSWIQTTGRDKIDEKLISIIGDTIKKHYL